MAKIEDTVKGLLREAKASADGEEMLTDSITASEAAKRADKLLLDLVEELGELGPVIAVLEIASSRFRFLTSATFDQIGLTLWLHHACRVTDAKGMPPSQMLEAINELIKAKGQPKKGDAV